MANSVKGKVSINSDAVSQALSQISKSCTLLEGDVVGKIPGNFQVLIDLGLLSTAPSKLQKQVTDLVSVHKSIASQMSTHLDTVIQTDNNLYNQFTGGNNASQVALPTLPSTSNPLSVWNCLMAFFNPEPNCRRRTCNSSISTYRFRTRNKKFEKNPKKFQLGVCYFPFKWGNKWKGTNLFKIMDKHIENFIGS